jgi:hypothetical protein
MADPNNLGTNFERPVFTKAGFLLSTRVTAGKKIPLFFSKMCVGKGILPAGDDPSDLTDMIDYVMDIPIIRYDVLGPGVSEVTGRVSNENVTSLIPIFEVGVFAQDPDTGLDILYSYMYTQSTPAALYPPDTTLYFGSFTVFTITGEAENITVNVVPLTWAREIAYDSSVSQLPASDLQGAIDSLAGALKGHVGIGGTAQHPLGNGTAAGFSLNNYSTADKNKLAGIQSGATTVTVQNVLTSTSTTNALSAAQGKVLNDEKLDSDSLIDCGTF